MLREYPVWREGVVFPQLDNGRSLPTRADVVIIGAGYTGLAAARTLAEAGANVIVLEAQTIGWGASSRNGGMVLTGLKLDATQLVARYGRAAAQRMFAASLAAIDCVEQLVHEDSIACDFQRSGHVLLAVKPAHARAFATEAALLHREFGHETRVLGPGDLRSEIGSAAYYGGLLDITSAGINPARYIAGLGLAAIRAGAQIFEHSHATYIARNGRGWQINTGRGVVQAGAVLVASGAYTGRESARLQRKIVPLGSYIIATAPLPERVARELLPHNRMAFDTRHLLHYFRLTPDRRMLFGGRARFFPESPQMVRESAAVLQRAMAQVFPQLHGAPIEYAWGGTLDVAFDLMPHTGQRDGMYYALGYAGHGVAMATYLGMQLGACLAGAPFTNPFAGLPFPGAPLGLYDGRPWFLPLVGAWYRFQDWLW